MEQPTKEQVDQSIAHIINALNDYAATLSPSVRGPFAQTNQQAIGCIQAVIETGTVESNGTG